MKKSVLHIYKDYYPPVIGGIEKNIHYICNGIKDEYDVKVLVCSTNRKTEIEEIDGIEVIKAGTLGRFSSAPLSHTFPSLLKKYEADILHFHLPNPTAVVSYFMSRPRGKVVATYHSDIVRQSWAMFLFGPVLSRFLKRADKVLATSPYYILSSEYLNAIKNKCESLPLGIDIGEFAPDDDTLAKAKEIKAQYDRPIIVFVGKLRYYKGLQFLIKAMPVLNAQLLIVGDGFIEKELKKLCKDLGIEHKVKFCGELSGDDLKAHLYAGDVFCLPSHLRSEAFGVCQIEAMACGLPVVSTALNTGVPYVNRHKKTGLIVPPADSIELSKALNKLLVDDDLRKQLSENAKKHVLENFTHTLMIERIKNVYKKLLEE